MLKVILVCVLVCPCLGYGMFGASNCKIMYPKPDENNQISTNVCTYNDYVISNKATFWSPLPDCNKCMCNDGILHCCLYGIKKSPIAVPVWCEIQTIGETCNYKLVSKLDKQTECGY